MMRIVGNKLMAVCCNCGKIIRANKPLLGSFHICTTDEEQREYRDQISRAVAAANRELASASQPAPHAD